MQATIFVNKTGTFYTAMAPSLELVSYGHFQDEAMNGLTEELRRYQEQGKRTEREDD